MGKSPGANWIKTEAKDRKTQAEKALGVVRKQRKGKNFRLIKVCDYPLTYKEVEVKD